MVVVPAFFINIDKMAATVMTHLVAPTIKFYLCQYWNSHNLHFMKILSYHCISQIFLSRPLLVLTSIPLREKISVCRFNRLKFVYWFQYICVWYRPEYSVKNDWNQLIDSAPPAPMYRYCWMIYFRKTFIKMVLFRYYGNISF